MSQPLPELTLHIGDSRTVMPTLADESVQCCVTSPPYWGLRDYGHDDQIGLEKSPELFVEELVKVFREVKRVLKQDGTCWINLGDSYNNVGGNSSDFKDGRANRGKRRRAGLTQGLKPKDLVGIPWMVASEAHFATYPPALITPCILAGTKPGDVVLDPFGGSGTTGEVALGLGRSCILIDANPSNQPLILRRTDVTLGLPLS